VEAALREAREELGLASHAVDVRGSSTASCGGWTYETVLAVPTQPLDLHDHSESDGHRWVPLDDVDALPLHPSFRRAWSAPDSAIVAFVADS